jgi:hypothetical protein
MQRSIGDVLSAHNIPWKYHNNGFNESGTGSPLDAYCNICNSLEYEVSYPSMVAADSKQVLSASKFSSHTFSALGYSSA